MTRNSKNWNLHQTDAGVRSCHLHQCSIWACQPTSSSFRHQFQCYHKRLLREWHHEWRQTVPDRWTHNFNTITAIKIVFLLCIYSQLSGPSSFVADASSQWSHKYPPHFLAQSGPRRCQWQWMSQYDQHQHCKKGSNWTKEKMHTFA